MQLIWVRFFECALGHVDHIFIYIYLYWYMWCWFSRADIVGICSVIHTYCICNYTYFCLGPQCQCWTSKNNLSHIDYIHIYWYNIYLYNTCIQKCIRFSWRPFCVRFVCLTKVKCMQPNLQLFIFGYLEDWNDQLSSSNSLKIEYS